MSDKNRLFLIYPISAIFALFTTYRSFDYILDYGIGLSPDSLQYLVVSKNLLVPPSMGPWYPFTLFFAHLFSINGEIWAAFCNLVALFLSVFLSVLLIFRLTQSIIYSILAGILLNGSFSLYFVSVALWTETLFIFYNVLFFYILSYLDPAKRSTFFYLIVLVTILATISFLQRLMGVIVIGIGALYLICYFTQTQTWKNYGWRSLRIYLTTTLTAVFLWTAIMKLIPGHWWFIRNGEVSLESIFGGVINIGNTLSYWGYNVPENPHAPLITLAFFILLFVVIIGYLIRWKKVSKKENFIIIQYLFPIFLLIYVVSNVSLLIYQRYNIDIISSRLASVIYIPLVLGLLLVFHQIFFANRSRIIKYSFIGLLFGISLAWYGWVSLPIINSWSNESNQPHFDFQLYVQRNQELFNFINKSNDESNCFVVVNKSFQEYEYFFYPKCEHLNDFYPVTKSKKINNGRPNYFYVVGMPLEKLYNDIPQFKEKYVVIHIQSFNELTHVLSIIPNPPN